MQHPGRKSAAELAITPAEPLVTCLQPPSSLAEPEALLFRQITFNCASDHFQKSDLPLLTRYCEASILSEQAAQQLRQGAVIDGKPSPWLYVREKATREMVALSMRLRLSPQARCKGHALPKSKEVPRGVAPWHRQPEEDDYDEVDDEAHGGV